MKRFIFCVFLLLGLCMFLKADMLMGQLSVNDNRKVPASAMGRPWETDDYSMPKPVDLTRGDRSTQEHITLMEGETSPRLKGRYRAEIPYGELPFYEAFRFIRYEVIFFNLFCR